MYASKSYVIHSHSCRDPCSNVGVPFEGVIVAGLLGAPVDRHNGNQSYRLHWEKTTYWGVTRENRLYYFTERKRECVSLGNSGIDRRENIEQKFLKEFIEDMTAPEVCFSQALWAMIKRGAPNASQKTINQIKRRRKGCSSRERNSCSRPVDDSNKLWVPRILQWSEWGWGYIEQLGVPGIHHWPDNIPPTIL